jgi:hypothetical protein
VPKEVDFRNVINGVIPEVEKAHLVISIKRSPRYRWLNQPRPQREVKRAEMIPEEEIVIIERRDFYEKLDPLGSLQNDETMGSI